MNTLHLVMQSLPDADHIHASDTVVWFDRAPLETVAGQHRQLGLDIDYQELTQLLLQFERIESW